MKTLPDHDHGRNTATTLNDSHLSHGQQRPRQSIFTVLVVVLLLDVTGSMQFAIDAMVRALNRFLDILVEAGIAPEVGLVLFRDELIGEAPEIYPVGSSVEEIKEVLSHAKAGGGGDDPESVLPAIMHGLGLLDAVRPGAQKMFLLVTDNPPHDPEKGLTAASVLEALRREQVMMFPCTPAIEPFKTFANATQGTLFPLEANIDRDAFKEVLLAVAHTTVKTIKSADFAISDEVRALLARTKMDG